MHGRYTKTAGRNAGKSFSLDKGSGVGTNLIHHVLSREPLENGSRVEYNIGWDPRKNKYKACAVEGSNPTGRGFREM